MNFPWTFHELSWTLNFSPLNFQIEAIRRFLRRFLKKKAVLFINIFPNISITKKPNDIRQGRGKGGVKYWCHFVKKGNVLIEVRGTDTNLTKKILKNASNKLALKTYVFNRQQRWIF